MFLAFETSCDDSSVAVVTAGGKVLGLTSQNQDAAHAAFGGVVPEIAYRNHTQALLPLMDHLLKELQLEWKQIEGLAVTTRPGLMGSLMVGAVVAETLAMTQQKTLIGVNHLHGHIVAPFLSDENYQPAFGVQESHLCLAVSGGHTSIYHVEAFPRVRVLETTPDDAAGECLDKFAKMLGLGFPGGPRVDREAQNGNPQKYQLMDRIPSKLSFSGLKASAQRWLQKNPPTPVQTADLCASFQEHVVAILMHHLKECQRKTGIRKVTITGGVSANTRLRQVAQQWAREEKLELLIPPTKYCTDNAAMIGYAARFAAPSLHLQVSTLSQPTDFLV